MTDISNVYKLFEKFFQTINDTKNKLVFKTSKPAHVNK